MHSSIATKNEIAKAVYNAMEKQIAPQSIEVPTININQNIHEIKKEFWLGNFKISIKIY